MLNDAVWVGKNELRRWQPSEQIQAIGNKAYWDGFSTDGFIYENYTTPSGAFEVYFMNTKIYSKLSSHEWPNTSLLAKKCANIYKDFKKGKDISEYEYGPTKAQQVMARIQENQSMRSSSLD